MQRLSKFKRNRSDKDTIASHAQNTSKQAKHSQSKQTAKKNNKHSLDIKSKTLSMSDKKKELLSLKRSLEQKKLLLCCERGDVETLKAIFYKYRGSRHKKHLRALLEYEDISNNMKTPLVYCCISGHVECLLELLRNGINLEHTVSGSSALYHATSRGNIECVEELLIYGSNPNTLNHKSWTCLMNASYFGHSKIAELLLKYGADPDIQRTEFNHKCALHFASKNGRYKVVELLLQFGADPDSFDTDDHMTSLMYAANNGYYRIVQLLILYGANPYIKNQDGKCAIDLIQPSIDLEDELQTKNDNEIRNELFTFIQQSTHIYNAINKLIVPETWRKIMKSLSRIHFIYPPIIAQLRSISHMYQLGESEFDIHHFNDVVCGQLTADLCGILPVDVMNDDDDDDDDSSYDDDVHKRHAIVLKEFHSAIMLCRIKVDRYEAHVDESQNTLKQIECDMMERHQEENEMIAKINLLQRQLKLCQHKQKQLKSKQISTKNMIVNYKTSLIDLRHSLGMKNEVFMVIDKASRNIRNVCDCAKSVPMQHRRELQMEYKKKRRMLEENWSLWNLDDVITWICSLDPSGKFLKYKENLGKLKHLDDTSSRKKGIRRKRSKRNVNKIRMDYAIGNHYDGDEGKSEDLHANDKSYIKLSADVEGKSDYKNEIEDDLENITISDADFADDDDDQVAIENNVKNKHKIQENDSNDISQLNNSYIINEGQYHIESSDSGSNNDKHGASEVIISALMPKNDTSSEEEDLEEVNMNQLLDSMGNIFENFSNKESQSQSRSEEYDDDVLSLSDESCSAPDTPILESINNTVLKMCGIRDAKDRKIIMFHIAKLCNKEEEKDETPPQKRQKSSVNLEHEDVDNKEAVNSDDTESVEDETPSEFMCPITKVMMEDPVICSDGHSYERVAIEDWLLNHDKSPITNTKLVTKQVFPNHSLRSMIALHRMANQKNKPK